MNNQKKLVEAILKENFLETSEGIIITHIYCFKFHNMV